MATLTKSQTILTYFGTADGQARYVKETEEGETPGSVLMLVLSNEAFIGFDAPGEITVTVESGDKLNESDPRMADRAEIYKSPIDGQWYVRTVAANNRIIMHTEGYHNKGDALRVGVDLGLPIKEVKVTRDQIDS